LECEELGLAFEDVHGKELSEKITKAELGDKLGGWPVGFRTEMPELPSMRSPKGPHVPIGF
jgi:hypothetical protein